MIGQSARGSAAALLRRARAWEIEARPVHPETRAALRRRWSELPAAARIPAQTLGQHAVGCEGTHGVFPRCTLACTPCYHSRDANRVAVSGSHTRTEGARQMALLRTIRGPRAHAQLIGGEVSLLPADDHAATLKIMREHGREPMSMTHGDFDYGYLRDLAIGPGGKRRLDRVSFAGHFDMMMFGRRGIERPPDEAPLNAYRLRFTAMFTRLKRDHGVRSFLAHNMTVTPANLDQIADVIRACKGFGFGLFSFQPAAFIGDDRRWHEGYRDTTGDDVWAQIEAGAGRRLPFGALQFGDERCNRTTFGFFLGEAYHPMLDELNPADLVVRDAFLRYFGGMSFSGTPRPLLAVKIARVVARHPSVIAHLGGWLVRATRAAELRNLATKRLRACSYAMAHPETGELVPACVQHGVLDPGENIALRRLLPLTPVTGRRSPGPGRAAPDA
jgi:hypothetical protein